MSVVRKVLARLWELDKGSQIMFERHVSQLLILSRLRDMEQLIEKEVEKMPVTIDIEKDYLYMKGMSKGMVKGKNEGLHEAIELGLELKFGNTGLQLMNRIRPIHDIVKLEAIKETIRKAVNLHEVVNCL
jgi:predicted transposase YdaD